MLDFSQNFQDEKHQPFLWEGDSNYCAVLVHGFPGTPNEMRPIAEVLYSYGWTVEALLLPGFGVDINSLPDRTYSDWLSAVLNALNRHRKHYEKVVLVGFSMGGAISIQASVSTNIDHLLLLAPFWKINNILWTMLPAIKWIIPKFQPFRIFKPDFNDPEVRSVISDWLPSVDVDDPIIQKQIREFTVPTLTINQIRIAGNHARQSIDKINVPATIIQGRQDEAVLPHLTQILVDNMTTDVNYILVDGDHNLTEIRKPYWENVKPLIRQFASQIGSTGNL
jgi:carboxylesterase